MSDYSREKEISELKALRAELLSQYEDNKDENKLSVEESVLLRQTLLNDYDGDDNSNKYIDSEDSDDSEQSNVLVKKLTRGRDL